MLNKGTIGTIVLTSLVWRGPWLGIEPGTSRTRSQHYTTRLSRRLYGGDDNAYDDGDGVGDDGGDDDDGDGGDDGGDEDFWFNFFGEDWNTTLIAMKIHI